LTILKTIGETEGDFIVMFGRDLSPEAQAALANSAAVTLRKIARVLLHPLPLYNNSVGAHDMTAGRKSLDEVLKTQKRFISPEVCRKTKRLLANKDFVVVQELFETATTEFADVVLPAASRSPKLTELLRIIRVRSARSQSNRAGSSIENRLGDHFDDRARNGRGFRL
jgi:NADH dehydrogenase/NADH:ubiquinone oxidoreductase subunit G